jgi:hypothetical protein
VGIVPWIGWTGLAVYLVVVGVPTQDGSARVTSLSTPAGMLVVSFLIAAWWWRSGGYTQRITLEPSSSGVRLSTNGRGRAPLRFLDVPRGSKLKCGFTNLGFSRRKVVRELTISYRGTSLAVWSEAFGEATLLEDLRVALASEGVVLMMPADDAESMALSDAVEEEGDKEDAEQQRAASIAVPVARVSGEYGRRGLHPLLGRAAEDAVAWSKIWRVAAMLGGTGVVLWAGILAVPGWLTNDASMLEVFGFLGVVVGAIAWVVGIGLAAGRSLVAARVGSPLYLWVGAKGARLVQWGWPLRWHSIRLKAGTMVFVMQYARAGGKAAAGDLNRWNVAQKMAWLDDYPDSRVLRFCTYYRASVADIEELRSALEAHGVALKYRASAP